MRGIVVLILMLASFWAGAWGHASGGYRRAFLLGAIVLALALVGHWINQHHGGGSPAVQRLG